MNLIGVAAALAAFLGIWIGHVAVRRIEFRSSTTWLPATSFVLSGTLLGWLALSVASLALSAGAGILGITLFWDAMEIFRQQRRVANGHAPANPDNPRHQRLLQRPGSRATRVDLLKREPQGRAGNL